MRARCRLRLERHGTRSRPTGGRGGGALTTGAPPSNTNRSRNTESAAAASATAVGCRWVGVSTVVYYPSDIAVVASSFFSLHLFLPHNIAAVCLLSVFFLAPSPRRVEAVFVTYPASIPPRPYSYNNTYNRSYRVHVVNTRLS